MIDVLLDVLFDNVSILENIEKIEINTEIQSFFATAQISIKDKIISYDLARDEIAHIKIKIKRDTILKEYDFYIDDIEYKTKKENTLILKTKGCLLYEPFSIKEYQVWEGLTANQIIKDILDSRSIDFVDNLPQIKLGGNYESDNFTEAEIIKDLLSIIQADYYYKDNKIYFEPKKAISPEPIITETFKSKDIVNYNSQSSIDKTNLINKLYVNIEHRDIFAEPTLNLDIEPSPQQISPTSTLTYIDTSDNNKEYKIVPKKAIYKLYFSPLDEIPTIDGLEAEKVSDYIAIEKENLKDSDVIETLGGIKSIIDLQLSENENDYDKAKATFYTTELSTKQNLTFISDLSSSNFADGNNIKVVIKTIQSSQSISSSISGSGSGADPYIYTLELGEKQNIDEVLSQADITIKAHSFNTLTDIETPTEIKATCKATEINLEDYKIIVNGESISQNVEFVRDDTNKELIFKVKKELLFDKNLLESLLNNATTIVQFSNLVVNTQNSNDLGKIWLNHYTTQEAGTLAGEIVGVKYGENDPYSIMNFVNNDPKSTNILKVLNINDKTSIPYLNQIEKQLEGGYGNATYTDLLSSATFKVGYNKIILDKKYTGDYKLSYLTDIYRGEIEAVSKETKKYIQINLLNAEIDYTHLIEAKDYFPEPFLIKIDLLKDWNFETNEAINAEFDIYKIAFDTGAETFLKKVKSNSFAELNFLLSEYSMYSIKKTDKDTLYIKYFANVYEKIWNSETIKGS